MPEQEYTFKVAGEWHDTLLDMPCPAQCYLPIEFDEEKYIIYLRWRHDDPWTGGLRDGDDEDFIEGAYCLFQKYHEQYSFEEIDMAREAIISLTIKWLKERKRKKR